jgi:hypothetical protein
MAKTRKPTCELLLPAAKVWQSWSTAEDGRRCASRPLQREPLSFGKDVATRRVLALPVSQHFWVLPAWLKGQS